MKKTPKNYEMTDRQIEIITGSMLGDGFLRAVGRHNVKNSYYIEAHSLKQQSWLEWKANELQPLSPPIKFKEVQGRKRENGKIIADPTKKLKECRLQTLSHVRLTELEKKWYLRDNEGNYILNEQNRRIKTIPNDLKLTPLIITVWFLDDGSNDQLKRRAVFNTQSFTKSETSFLCDKLNEFNIHCGIAKNKDNYVIITKTSSYLDLISLISEYLPTQDMQYKIDLSKYREPDFSNRIQPTISEKIAKEILEQCFKGESTKDVMKQFNVSKGLVDGIRYRKTWKHLKI